jgi:signal peptidase II
MVRVLLTRAPRRWLAHARWAPLALLIVVVDQITKAWAVDALDNGHTIDLVWTLRFNLTYNKGASFGVGQGWGPVIGAIAMVVVVVLLLNLQRGSRSRATAAAVGAIVGGAVGNLLDRLFREPYWLRGGVVDFIDLQWFPIFNVADIGITVGGAALLLAAWQSGREAEAASPAQTGEGNAIG